jgi:hypothetical protein
LQPFTNSHFHFLNAAKSALSKELLLISKQNFNRAIKTIELMVQELINVNVTGEGTLFTEHHLCINAATDHPLHISYELSYVSKEILG